MEIAFLAGIALASLTPSFAQAQDLIQWTAPASPNGAPSYFPMGTPVQLTTRTELNTKDSRAGDRFYLEVAEPLVYRGQVVVPAGSVAVGEVMRSERNGMFGKRGEIEVRLNYVQTPSGPVRLSGRTAQNGKGQGLLAIGGAAVIAWPMLFIHGTSGKLRANTAVTAYLADDLRFNAQPGAMQAASVAPEGQQVAGIVPAHFDASVFAANRP